MARALKVFVTTGITGFPALIREMDDYARSSGADVVCQIGQDARYLPAHCTTYRLVPDLTPFMEKADVVVTHGGAATLFEALHLGRRVVAVANPGAKSGHQEDIVSRLAAEKVILAARPGEVSAALADDRVLEPYRRPACHIHETGLLAPHVTDGKTVMLVLGSGGHTAEMIELSRLMGSGCRYVYLVSLADDFSQSKILHAGEVIHVKRPTQVGVSPWQDPFAISSALRGALRVVRKTHFDIIVGSGPGICVFPMLVAKMHGAKVVFVETASRCESVSLTGRLVYPLADRFFVQWPEQKRHYEKASFCGRLM